MRTLPLAALSMLAVIGCGKANSTAASSRPNVLILVLDALRADALSSYGCPRETTPVLDGLASGPDAVSFRRHYVTSTWTKPSTASLFTGLYVFEHGVIDGHTKKDPGGDWREVTTQILAPEHVTLAERLQDAGYSTFGIVKSRHLDAEYGFAQGFEAWIGPGDIDEDDDRVEETIERMEQIRSPFFAYVHLSATHHPYPADERDREFMAAHGFPYDEDARKSAGVDFTTPEIQDRINQDDFRITPDDARFLRLIYEATTREMDATLVAPILEALDDIGIADSTLIIVTADHGEQLYDHEGYGHTTLYEEVVRVPLIVRFPRGRYPASLPHVVTEPSSAIDLHATLVAFAGLPPTPGLPTVDLFAGRGRDFAFAETKESWTMIRDGWKLFRGVKRTRLFDLRTDPGEQRDVFAEHPDIAEAIREFTEALLANNDHGVAPVISSSLDPAAIEDLRQLGYIK